MWEKWEVEFQKDFKKSLKKGVFWNKNSENAQKNIKKLTFASLFDLIKNHQLDLGIDLGFVHYMNRKKQFYHFERYRKTNPQNTSNIRRINHKPL